MKRYTVRNIEQPRRLNTDVRRERATGDYDKTAREAQHKASAYGRARGNS